MGIQWLKFFIKDKLTNFNIIPTGDQKKIPSFYKSVIDSLFLMKKIDLENKFNYKSELHFSLKIIISSNQKLNNNVFIMLINGK